MPSRIKILCDHQTLNEWQQKHETLDDIFKVLLRSYGGLFDFYTNIFERDIAFRLKKTEVWLQTQLEKLKAIDLIDYVRSTGEAQITLLENRFNDIHIPLEKIEFLRSRYKEKLDAVNRYTANTIDCRSKVLVNYFDEKNPSSCGVCDICLERKKQDLNYNKFKSYQAKINSLFNETDFKTSRLTKYVKAGEIEEYTLILRWLKDNGYASENKNGQWTWTSQEK